MFITNFSEHNKIWGHKKRFGGRLPRIPPCLPAWAESWPESLPLRAFVFVQGGLDILKIYI